METLLLVLIGVVIGWNLPQPQWARDLQDKALQMIRQATRKSG